MRASSGSRERHWERVGLVALALVAIGAVPVACGGNDKPAEAPPSNPSAMPASQSSLPSSSTDPAASAAPSASASTAVAAAASAAPLASVLTTDPNQLAQMYAGAAGAAQASLQPAGASGDAVDTGLKAFAAKHAPGMQPDGPIAKGTLQEGGHLAMLVNLQAGRCYSIVGFSPSGGVKDLDLHLLAPPFYNILSGEDTTDDNTPVVGKVPSPICPIIPVPIAYKVDIFAEKGAGPVGVQLYSKSK